MDTLTHALAGVLIGYAVKDRMGRSGMACAVAASVVPDADLALRLIDPMTFLKYHRVITNSLVVAPLIALAVAGITRLAGGYRRFFPLLLVALAAVGLHIFMDLTNSYGAKPFWPFSGKWYALDIVYILDPWLTGLIVLGILTLRGEGRKAAAVAACAALLFTYWGFRAYLHHDALGRVSKLYPEAKKVGAFPSAANPFKWRMVAAGYDRYWVGWYNLLTGDLEELTIVDNPPMTQVVYLANGAPDARIFLDFARFPLHTAEMTDNGWKVKVRDLRFATSDERRGFNVTVEVMRDGKTGKSEFSFR